MAGFSYFSFSFFDILHHFVVDDSLEVKFSQIIKRTDISNTMASEFKVFFSISTKLRIFLIYSVYKYRVSQNVEHLPLKEFFTIIELKNFLSGCQLLDF